MPTLNSTQQELFAYRCAENRNVLFGPFDMATNVTKLTRRNKWEEIAQELLSMGAPIKGVAHLRDTVWDNLKRRTVEKADKAAQSGASGVVITRVENLVLDAIGKDGAYLNGVGFPAAYPSFARQKRPNLQEVEANGDQSLNESSNNLNQSQSLDSSFGNYGAEQYTPQALGVLQNRVRNGNSTITRPPSPEFQFTAPLERQRPQASSTPRLRPQDQPLGQLPGQLTDQLPDLPERPESLRRRKVASHICTDENFKALKLKKAELDLTETEQRIALIEAQIQESRSRTEFFNMLISKSNQEPLLRNPDLPFYANL